MPDNSLNEFWTEIGAVWPSEGEASMPLHFGESSQEYNYLRQSVGLLDLSHRGRLCLAGEDRVRFLHGQVTNNVRDLSQGRGCYAALVTAKGKLESDLFIYAFENELLLDFEGGVQEAVKSRLERYVIADDVEVVDVQSLYGLLSLQGPKAAESLLPFLGDQQLPAENGSIQVLQLSGHAEIYVARRDRCGSGGIDLYLPMESIVPLADELVQAARRLGGGPAACEAFEMARIEAGIPLFGKDMNETNLAPEAGLDAVAINYQKGCYIGQEVIARIRTYGQVAKALRRLEFSGIASLPSPGAPLWRDEKQVGYFTSGTFSPFLQRWIGFGYVRKECFQPGTELRLGDAGGSARIIGLPFEKFTP